MTEPIQILKAARAKIASPGAWGKGRRNIDRPMETCCAAEAIEECSTWSEERKIAFRTLRNAAGLDNNWGTLTDWNDAPERTHTEILKAFDLAIAILSAN